VKKIILILLLVILTFSTPVLAQEPSDSPNPSTQDIEYDLPYPGLLPGSPLYPLKIVRDKIVEFFIGDTLKKSEFYLLQADKHLQASLLLSDSARYEDAEEMISKGENYLDMSYGKAVASEKEGKDAGDVLGRLRLSSIKHQQVIKSFLQSLPKNLHEKLLNDLKRAENLQKNLEDVESQSKR